ncbi:MAG TPA: Mur ligase family protein [Fimbriimonadaceae bacterium]|nr:Mur ligase family protein [Fimbriimonadaceae bacterium]
MTFQQAIEAISALEKRGWRLGLDRMQAFIAACGLGGAMGERPGSPRYIHIGGTNGKGSVTAFTQSLLIEQGYRAGANFSPFVYDVRERVEIGRDLIRDDEFARLAEKLLLCGTKLEDTEFGGPTEFEMKTALGFACWSAHACEWVALEVGLGGRLDATNVVDPAACAIVSIGWDHMAILGDTLEKIAFEKAGIIKPKRPVVIGPMPTGPEQVIVEQAREKDAPFLAYGREVRAFIGPDGYRVETPEGRYDALVPGVPGSMQGVNLAIAIAAAEAAGAVRDPGAIPLGIARAYAPGRFQRHEAHGQTWILDGAHNVSAVPSLVRSLFESSLRRRAEQAGLPPFALLAPTERPAYDGLRDPEDHDAFTVWRGQAPKLVLISAMLDGHEAAPFYEQLAPLCRVIHVPPIDFHRARLPQAIVEEVGHLFPRAVAHETLDDAMAAAIEDAGPEDTLLVTGSFYLVGAVGRAIGADRRQRS